MISIECKELNDAEYTRVRHSLLRIKGGSSQQEFLEAVRENNTFIEYIRSRVNTDGLHEVPLSPTPLTEHEFKAPPEDTEITLYKLWADLTPGIACRSTFWANLTCRHIEDQKLHSVYLAAAKGNSIISGAERIDLALTATDNDKRPLMIDECVRTVLRRLGGIPEDRGNRTVYVDCPFGRLWWRGQIVAEVAQENDYLATQIHAITRISQTYWEKLVDRIVHRNSTFGSLRVRSAFIRRLTHFITDKKVTTLKETKKLESACRKVSVYQGIRELSILNDAELEEIMDTVLCSV